MQRVKLYGCLNGPRAVKDADTGEPTGGVLARIDIVIEPNQPTLAIWLLTPRANRMYIVDN